MSKAYFTFDKTLKIFAEGFNPVYRENGDFWRLHLDYGKAGHPRELGVYSHMQKEPVTEKTADGLRIIYNSVKAEDGSEHDIKLTLEVKNTCEREPNLFLTIDGRVNIRLDHGNIVRVMNSEKITKLIRVKDKKKYSELFAKLYS